MFFCTKLQKKPEMLAQFAKKLYLCIRIEGNLLDITL